MTQLKQILDKAKINLISRSNSVFISTILFSLKFKWNSDIPSARTNGICLEINPDWFSDMTAPQRVGLLAHEAYHVALLHPVRGLGKDRVRFNKAADHVINLILLDNGFKLPEGGMHDDQYKGMSTEEVYELLPVTPPDEAYDMDIVLGDSMGSKISNEELIHRLNDVVSKAVIQSKVMGESAGSLPNEIAILHEEYVNPKLPWNVILQNHIDGYAKNDYSYTKPNKRYMPDFYLPSLYAEGMENLVFAIDASYSVSDSEFNIYIAEIEQAMESTNARTTTIVDFDTQIKTIHTLEEGDSPRDLEFKGRGGTDIEPVLDHFLENPPNLLIIFTDGHFTPYQSPVPFPVIWVIFNNSYFDSPFGTIIHYKT